MLDELKNFNPELSIPQEKIMPAMLNLLLMNVALSQASLQAISTISAMLAAQTPLNQQKPEIEKVVDRIIESYEHEVTVNLEETKAWLLAKFGE